MDPKPVDSTRAITYIGTADFQSVRERWNGHGSDGLLDEIDADDHGVLVLVGIIDVVDGTREAEADGARRLGNESFFQRAAA